MQIKFKTKVLFFLPKAPESTSVIIVFFYVKNFGANPIILVSNINREPKSNFASLFDEQNIFDAIFGKNDVSAIK